MVLRLFSLVSTIRRSASSKVANKEGNSLSVSSSIFLNKFTKGNIKLKPFVFEDITKKNLAKIRKFQRNKGKSLKIKKKI